MVPIKSNCFFKSFSTIGSCSRQFFSLRLFLPCFPQITLPTNYKKWIVGSMQLLNNLI
uniref:Uncharacterized protein n=1 Tax=Helianthus annuus TaxID=4232 RepID=A0A251U913_HELAN